MVNPESGEVTKKVLVLYVGGTIGMTRDCCGVLSPQAGTFGEALKNISQLHDSEYIKSHKDLSDGDTLALPLFQEKFRILYKIKEFKPLLDSSNMGVEDWKKIAVSIKEHYSEYNGFVVAHGTDTLAYTSSALSFMFENPGKSIIITGSQLPIHDPRSDGVHNLHHSLIFAGAYFIPEVCVFFGKVLLRGNRTSKISSDSFDGFEAPNMDALASVGTELHLRLPKYVRSCSEECILHTDLNVNVNILTIYPEISEKMVRCAFEPPAEGVVLLTYGAGNIPSNKLYLSDTIKEATDRGVLVVNCSQCPRGSVKQIYETNKVLVDSGALSAFDMTVEAAYTKLMHVLAMKNLSKHEKKRLMESNLRGELTN